MSAEHNLPIEISMIHTDLAVEAHELSVGRGAAITEGFRTTKKIDRGITTSWIWVESEQAAAELGKMPGTYLTLEVPELRGQDSGLEKRVTDQFTTELAKFLEEIGISADDEILIVGLGNIHVTADALGPMVVQKSLVTRHLFQVAPEYVDEGYRSVSAIAPGVMATTGVETSETVAAVVDQIKPACVIAIDALASRSLARLNTTIQVADTGIHPGSGVGNKRKAINKEALGVPVIAIGVPTVVDAVTITHDTIDYLLAYLSREMEGKRGNPLDPYNRPTVRELEEQDVSEETKAKLMGMFGELTDTEKRDLIREVLSPLGQNLIVTPKEVDSFMSGMANIVAAGLNRALHTSVTAENVLAHLQ